MGRATILANLGEGRYRLQMDWGAQKKQDNLSAANEALNKLQIKLAQVNAQIVQADAAEDELRAQLEAEIVAYEAVIAAANAKGQAPPKPEKYLALLKKLRETEGKNQPIRTLKKSLEQNKSELFKKIAYWNAFEAVEQRDAWCVDYTTWAEVGSSVATLEIPGETNIILIAPGCREWNEDDGELVAREVQRPEQVYFNAAILPGWQVEYPTYRGAVIDMIYRADATFDGTCDVTLLPIPSSAQGLGVNQTERLFDVPIRYMAGDHETFIEGDRVVVKFLGQNWNAPVVIGFLEHPRPSFSWGTVTVYASISSRETRAAAQSQILWWLSLTPDAIVQTQYAAAPSSKVTQTFLAVSHGTIENATVNVSVPSEVDIGATTWHYEYVPSWPIDQWPYTMPVEAAKIVNAEWTNTGFGISQRTSLKVTTSTIAWDLVTHPTRAENVIDEQGEIVSTTYLDPVTAGLFVGQAGSFLDGTAAWYSTTDVQTKNLIDLVTPAVWVTYRGRTREFNYIGSRALPGASLAEMYFVPRPYE